MQKTVVFGGHFGFFALEKNAQHLQSGIHQIWIQHIQIDKKQQKNIIYYEKQGHTIISITPSLDYKQCCDTQCSVVLNDLVAIEH